MKEVRVLAASGVCGSGFREESLEEAMGRRPDFIGCDGGSTDPGPYPLGAGRLETSHWARLFLDTFIVAGAPVAVP